MRNDLGPAQREKLASLVSEMQDVVRELKEVLHLQGKVRNAKKSIIGSCTVLWISLSEIQGNGLRGYGEPPPGLTEYLAPKLEFLIQSLRVISHVARGAGGE